MLPKVVFFPLCQGLLKHISQFGGSGCLGQGCAAGGRRDGYSRQRGGAALLTLLGLGSMATGW